MGIDHGNDMACGAERTGLAPVLPGKVFYDSVRCLACNLGENGHCMLCRCHGLSYGCLVAAIKMSMTSFFQLRRQVMGRLCQLSLLWKAKTPDGGEGGKTSEICLTTRKTPQRRRYLFKSAHIKITS